MNKKDIRYDFILSGVKDAIEFSDSESQFIFARGTEDYNDFLEIIDEVFERAKAYDAFIEIFKIQINEE